MTPSNNADAAGLIDAHVHVTSQADLLDLAAHGITTALDMATRSPTVLHELVERARGAGLTVPTVLTAGAPASAPGGIHTVIMGFPSESALTGPADSAPFVRARVSEGARYIKLIVDVPGSEGRPVLDPQTIAAVTGAAHNEGLLTIAHAVTEAAMQRAVQSGVDILTHVPVNAALSEAFVQELAERRTVIIPTLTMMAAVAALPSTSPAYRPGADFRHAIASAAALRTAGVTVLAGTDANSSPLAPAKVSMGTSLDAEMGLLQQCGFTPAEALDAATSATAQVFGLSSPTGSW